MKRKQGCEILTEMARLILGWQYSRFCFSFSWWTHNGGRVICGWWRRR